MPDVPLTCSFCGKSQSDVRKLIAGRNACICDECVDVCEDIIADDTRFTEAVPAAPAPIAPSPWSAGSTGPVFRCALCGMPTPPEDTLHITGRGSLCQGCIGEIEAEIATRRDQDKPEV